jgi:putative membrane protein
MKLAANVLIALVAIAHVGFLALEMFLWTTPYGQKSFNMTAEFAKSSAVLAANQGLYNWFLAAGLLWGLITKERAFALKVFFARLRHRWPVSSERRRPRHRSCSSKPCRLRSHCLR